MSIVQPLCGVLRLCKRPVARPKLQLKRNNIPRSGRRFVYCAVAKPAGQFLAHGLLHITTHSAAMNFFADASKTQQGSFAVVTLGADTLTRIPVGSQFILFSVTMHESKGFITCRWALAAAESAFFCSMRARSASSFSARRFLPVRGVDCRTEPW